MTDSAPVNQNWHCWSPTDITDTAVNQLTQPLQIMINTAPNMINTAPTDHDWLSSCTSELTHPLQSMINTAIMINTAPTDHDWHRSCKSELTQLIFCRHNWHSWWWPFFLFSITVSVFSLPPPPPPSPIPSFQEELMWFSSTKDISFCLKLEHKVIHGWCDAWIYHLLRVFLGFDLSTAIFDWHEAVWICATISALKEAWQKTLTIVLP